MLHRIALIAIAGTAAGLVLLLMLLPTSKRPPAAASANGAPANSFVISNVRVFDGNVLLSPTTLVVADGVIAGIGNDVATPAGAQTIDGSGKTVLPGLIDAHTHTYGPARRDALRFGVTSMLDMFTSPALLDGNAQAREKFGRSDQAALFSAGMLATVDGGHGTQFGVPIDTLSGPGDAPAWVAARRAEGSDYIKLVYIPDNPQLPSLDFASARAVIDAAHSAGLMAVAHIDTHAAAMQMLDAGIDGLVHVFADEPVSDAFIERALERGLFVIPTLAIIAMVDGEAPGQALLDDAELAPYLDNQQRNNLAGDFGRRIPGYSLTTAIDNVRRLHAAGVPILAGSDAPNPGTAHGATLHQELELLTRAGLSGEAALGAATALPARLFDADGRGRIAVGARADVLLVDGDPVTDIRATRAIDTVFRNGYRVERSPAAATASERSLPESLGDFESGLQAPAGLTWTTTSDEMMGGNSAATLSALPEGAGQSAGAMRIAATVGGRFPYPWAGAYLAVLPEGEAANIGDYARIAFEVRGTPARYRLMLFTAEAYGAPPTVEFDVAEDWDQVSIPLDAFGEIDTGRFTGFAIVTPMQAGDYRFDIDNVRMQGD